MGQMGTAKWDLHGESGALANCALDSNVATMESDEFLDECQSNPSAFVGPGMCALDPMKALKYPLAVLLWNADSRVADLQFNSTIA